MAKSNQIQVVVVATRCMLPSQWENAVSKNKMISYENLRQWVLIPAVINFLSKFNTVL